MYNTSVFHGKMHKIAKILLYLNENIRYTTGDLFSGLNKKGSHLTGALFVFYFKSIFISFKILRLFSISRLDHL